MNLSIKRLTISVSFLALQIFSVNAQQYLNPEYIKVTNERAAKIVETLELSNPEKEKIVTDIIAQQYRDLSRIQDERDAEIDEVKKSDLSKEVQGSKIDEIKTEADKSVSELHKSYLNKLSEQLSEDKIDAVKDGMTYGVFPKTYASYLEMIPSLTEEEKEYIYNNLKEAREYAMDGGSSDEKHKWFGKYKGRINNYLSARGYDLEKEREGWYKRIEEREKNKSKQ